jgi:hydrogenase small subunit
MRIHRRQFLKYCISSAAAIGLPLNVLGRLEQAMAAESAALPKVIWINGANCSGCTVSLANLFSDTGPRDIAELLLGTIDLAFHPTLMAATGDLAVQQLKNAAAGSYILAVDGGIPTAFNGNTCLLWTDNGREITALEAVQSLAPQAAAVLGIGTCASSGGMPAGNPNPTGIVSVESLAGPNVINIPGCPTHPDWIVWTIAHLLTGEIPQLDGQNRPSALFSRSVHRDCPMREREEAETFGLRNHCMEELGCKGEETRGDCPTRQWNGGTNWCIGAGGICIGCTESGFPDRFSPFYDIEYSYRQYEKPPPENDPVALTMVSAVWDRNAQRLTAAGAGRAGQIVTIFDFHTSQQLGAVSIDSGGHWRFTLNNPSSLPGRLRAVSGGETAVLDVSGLPEEEEEDRLTVRQALWRSKSKRLVVRGSGKPGERVWIYHGTTGDRLARARVKGTGRWSKIIKRPRPVPCSLLVASNGQEISGAVEKAPDSCV